MGKQRRFLAVLTSLALTLSLAAPVMAVNPASNLASTGQTLSIEITAPADGSRVNVSPGTVTVAGTASIGPLSNSGNVMYVVDVSGSTLSPTNQDCNGDQVVNILDDLNGDGYRGTTLDCEIAGVIALNGSLTGSPGASAGLIAFGLNAASADVDPAAGQQHFTSPLNADQDGVGGPDMEQAAKSLDATAGMVSLFTPYSVGSSSTNYNAALTQLANAFSGKAGQHNVAFFMSDGVPVPPSSFTTGPGSPLQRLAAAGIKVNTYSVGAEGAGCGSTSALKRIADATGSTCTVVRDPSQLYSFLVQPVTIAKVEVSLNGGAPTLAPPVGGNWSVPLTGLHGGTNVIRAIVTASDGSTATADVQVYGNRAPTADAGSALTVDEGSSVVLNGAALDPDGDVVAVSWAPSAHLTGADTATPTFTADDDMTETLTMSVSDPGGLPASSSTTVTVRNVAPTVGAIMAPVEPIRVGTAVSTTAPFTDPGVRDTHTAVWDWGDGTTSAGTVTDMGGSGQAGGSHAYTAAGIYTVTLTVTDKDGGVSTAIVRSLVVYDPNGGFVTGSGWIDSPAGAYAADPTLTGVVNFGFRAKYEEGASVPTGQTQFLFQVGDLNFYSTAYQWLVVGGARAQLKGTGAINGADSSYGFIVTVIDGQEPGGGGVDKFRIKIWDTASGQVIYDNQMGALDDAAPPTAIGDGSIEIHP